MKNLSKTEKDTKKLKNIESRDNGVKDFFESRDKTARGTKGLIENASKDLDEEFNKKKDLYEKSLEEKPFPSQVEPMFNGVFLTARRNKLTENGIYMPTAAYGNGGDTDLEVDFSDTQTVLAIGSSVHQVKPGMEVVLNMDSFKKRAIENFAQKVNKEYYYEVPIRKIEGVEYIYVSERDISYILNNNK